MSKKRIFSGVQPSGDVHIGNYLGAIRNWVLMQDEFESIFCIVDLHAITVPQNPEELRRKTLEVAKIYLASGIDPKKSLIYVQSHVKEHAELAWVLNTITGMSELEKMTQFKDKSKKEGVESAKMGLFDYPVLMAADILLYDTEVVPVGEDQLQHIELARDLAKRFNHKFGETFVVPNAHIKKEGMRVMGLDNPLKKMNKSADSEYNYISLMDTPEMVEKKIKRAVTDSGTDITYSDDRPAIKNLINIYASFSGLTPEKIMEEYAGKGFGDFKKGLTKVVLEFIMPFQERYGSLKDEEVIDLLRENAKKVESLAKSKMNEVKEKIGFLA